MTATQVQKRVADIEWNRSRRCHCNSATAKCVEDRLCKVICPARTPLYRLFNVIYGKNASEQTILGRFGAKSLFLHWFSGKPPEPRGVRLLHGFMGSSEIEHLNYSP